MLSRGWISSHHTIPYHTTHGWPIPYHTTPYRVLYHLTITYHTTLYHIVWQYHIILVNLSYYTTPYNTEVGYRLSRWLQERDRIAAHSCRSAHQSLVPIRKEITEVVPAHLLITVSHVYHSLVQIRSILLNSLPINHWCRLERKSQRWILLTVHGGTKPPYHSWRQITKYPLKFCNKMPNYNHGGVEEGADPAHRS